MTPREKLLALSAAAEVDATDCSQRGDREGAMYARGLRDAYANAALFVPEVEP